MAMLQLPVRNDFPAYEFQVELEGRIYILGFRFNTRANRWFMDIKDQSQTPIIMGILVQQGVPLTRYYVREALPPGNFWAIDQTGEAKEPDRENFGVDLILIYEESA